MRCAVAGAAAVTALAVSAGAVNATVSEAPPGPGSGPPGPARPPLLLIAGQQVTQQPGPSGRPIELVRPAAGGGGAVAVFSCGFFAVPAGAAQFPGHPGHGQETRLLKVSALERAQHEGRLPGPAGHAPTTIRANSATHTVTVHGTDAAGHPDNGDLVTVFNADNCKRFGDPAKNIARFRHGVAKFNVPDGHYWAVGNFFAHNKNGLVNRVVTQPQFSVSRNLPVTLDARTATQKITFATPRKASLQGSQFELRRDNPAGPPAFVDILTHHVTMLVSPVRRAPSVGALHAMVDAELTSPPGRGVPYAYDVAVADPPGLIGSQHYVVRQSSLATVRDRFFQDVPTAGTWESGGGFLHQDVFGEDGTGLRLPGRLVQYFTARPDVLWSTDYSTGRRADDGSSNSPRSFRPGQVLTEDWNDYPLHPAPFTAVSRFGPNTPSAARAGNDLEITVFAFSDNTPGHLGADESEPVGAGRFEVDQDGKKLAAGPDSQFVPPVTLSNKPSVIRFVRTASRPAKSFPLSSASRTVWTWRSRREPKATVPKQWVCEGHSGGKLTLTRRCVIQPMMTLRYQVARLGLDGTAPAGSQHISMTAGHLQAAAQPAVTRLTLSVSFDGGRTWRPATVKATGHGRFAATFTAPRHALVTMRTTARDAARGSITETITRAYRTAT
jgi:hypothetical protein